MEDYEHGEQREHSEAYYRSVAIHETGHAYISYLGGDCPSYITIESRANFGGYMQHANSEETPSYTREELLARIRTSLAGRAAEQVFYGREKALNTGASGDLKQASNLAFHIICTYGMEEDQYVVLSRSEILKSSMAGDYIRQVNELIRREMANTLAMIEDGKDVIRAIADELVKENHLTGEQFKTLMEKYRPTA
jgi:ATP-dependent Zn protease